MKIISRHVNVLSLHEVEQLLPPNHHLQHFDDKFSEGCLPEGKYFVFSLIFFSGKKRRRDSCLARITLYDVLEDCSPENHTNVDALVFGEFCEAIEEQLKEEIAHKTTWSPESPGSRKVWLVLHCIRILPSPLPYENYHKFQIIISPINTPQCDMWVMVEIPQHEAVSEYETSASLLPSPVVPELAPEPPQSPIPTTVTVQVHPSPPSLGSTSEPHKVCHSQDTPGLSPASHPAPHAASPKLHSISHFEKHPSSPVSHCIPLKASEESKHPSKTGSSGTDKKSTRGNSSSRSASRSNVSAQHPDPRRPHSSAPAQPQTPVKSGVSAPPSRPILEKKFKLTPMTMAKSDISINVACVLVSVEKDSHRAKNGIIYDVLKVTAKEMMDPSSPRTYMKVKVFRNDGVDYYDVSLRIGQVLLLKEMRCQLYNSYLDGIVCSTKRVCVYTRNEEEVKQWHSHPTSSWYPTNIENGDREADIQFDWWMEEGRNLSYDDKGKNAQYSSAAEHPTFTIAEIEGKGYFNLFCQVVKKFLYPSKSDSRCVLRVQDGTATKYHFEKFTCNPKEVKDHSCEYSDVGSLEVDIVIFCEIIPPEVENLEEGSFVKLSNMECGDLRDQHGQLVLNILDTEKYIILLNEDDPKLRILRERIESTVAAEEEASNADVEESEVGMLKELSQKMERTSHGGPSVDIELPDDTFDEYVREGGYKRSSRFYKQQVKKQCLESTSEQLIDATSPELHTSMHPLKHPSSPTSLSTPSQSPHLFSPLPQKHNSLQKSPSASKHYHHPCSPQPSPSRHPEHYPSLAKPHSTTGWGPNTHTHTPTSYTSDWKEQVHKSKVTEARQDLSANQPINFPPTSSKLQMCFHTDVENDTMKMNLEEFYKYEHVADEVYYVNASITDFRPVREGDCFHTEDHVCLHQWVWGMCQKCFSEFSSSRLRHIASLTLDSNRPSISCQDKLPCPNCNHECNSDGRSLRATSHQCCNTVVPFIKVKMEIEDPSTGFHLAPWLWADSANTFFNVTPTFEWLFQESEVQGLVEALLQQKTPPLDLGLKLRKGAVPCIVNTVLFTTPSYSHPPRANPPHLPISNIPEDFDSPIVVSPHPDSSDAMSPHLDAPTATSPHTESPTATTLHNHQSHVSANHILAKTQSNPSTPMKHKETPHQTTSTPTHTTHPNTPPQPEFSPVSQTRPRKYETSPVSNSTSSTTTKHLQTQPSTSHTKQPNNTSQQPHSKPSIYIHSKKYTTSPQSPSSSTLS